MKRPKKRTAPRAASQTQGETVGQRIVHSLQELLDVVHRGEDPAKHFTTRTYEVPAPPVFTGKQVRDLRLQLHLSQAMFAHLVGVSVKLVEAWEGGRRKPSPMANRLLEAIERDPKAFVRVKTSAA